MKKILLFALCALTVFCAVSCGNEKTEAPSVTADSPSTDAAGAPEATEQPAETEKPAASDSHVDVDLTTLNSTMVYSEVSNMINEPEKYVGKTIKMKGQFNASYFEGTGNYYYYVVIADATACCAQGLEFVWEGEHSFPDDYPENGAEVIVTGVYGQYEEL
ncbi:MAG: hypothetical protein IJU94_04615, partial [Clostridia bacterium]|nr:hypothetical protein [Clostridia bacterium]